MADKITIEIGGERIEIPEFAMDSSIKVLHTILRQQGAATTKASKKQTEQIGNLIKSLTGVNAKQTQQKEQKGDDKRNEHLKKISEKLTQNGKEQKGLLSKLGGGTGSLLGGVVSKFGRFGKMLNPITAGLFGLWNAVKAVTAFFTRLGAMENTLFRRGFNFRGDGTEGASLADGIAVFGAAAADASLSLDEFTELTSQFSMAVGEYGIKTISGAIKKTQDLLREQGYLGMSNAELAQGVGEMAEQFRGLGFDIAQNEQFLAQQTVKVLQVTQSFTKLTNTSNDVIRQMVMQATAMEAFRNAMQMLPQQLRAGATESSQIAFAGLGAFGEELGGQLTQAMSEGIGRGGLQFTEFGQQLAGVSPLLLNSLQELRDAAGSGDNNSVGQALENFRKGILEVSDNQREFLRALEISGDPMAKFVIKLANMNKTLDDENFEKLMDNMTSVSADQLGSAQTRLMMAMARVRTAFQKLQIAFLRPEIVDGFEKAVEFVETKLLDLSDVLKDKAFPIFNQFLGGLIKITKWLFKLIAKPFEIVTPLVTSITAEAGKVMSKMSARIIANSLWGGAGAQHWDILDEHHAKVKEAKNEKDHNKAIEDMYKWVFKQQTDKSGNITGSWLGEAVSWLRDDDTVEKKIHRLNEKLTKYGVNMEGYKSTKWKHAHGPVPPGTDGASTTPTSDATNLFGTDGPKSKIKIMPMYGNLDDYVDQNQTPQMKQLIRINRNLEAQLEELREQSNKTDKLTGFNQDQRDALRALRSDDAYSGT